MLVTNSMTAFSANNGRRRNRALVHAAVGSCSLSNRRPCNSAGENAALDFREERTTSLTLVPVESEKSMAVGAAWGGEVAERYCRGSWKVVCLTTESQPDIKSCPVQLIIHCSCAQLLGLVVE
jgi:hypothetical protein